MIVTANQLRRIVRTALNEASKELDHATCSPYTHSLAWIERNGKINILAPRQTHLQWAEERSKDEGWYDTGFSGLYADEVAMRKGYIRVSNGLDFSFIAPLLNQPDYVIYSILEIVLGCAKELKYDPEEQTMFLEQYTGRNSTPKVEIMSVADFVEKYGTDEHAERLYKALS